jgi:outer membrane protein assembly factor BamB
MARWRALALFVAASALGATAPAAAQAPPLPPLPPIGGVPAPPGEPQPGPGPPPAGPVSQAPGSVTDGVNPAHTGFFADDTLVPPLTKRWTVRAHGPALAAEGLVFALRRRAVVAFRAGSGKRAWSAPLPAAASAFTYGDGRVYAVTTEPPSLVALDATSGAQAWTRELTAEIRLFGARAVAAGGAVYVTEDTDAARIRAFNAADGQELWAADAEYTSPVAVDDERVYVVNGCAEAEAFDRRTGTKSWSYDEGWSCSPGAAPPALYEGRLYVGSDTDEGSPVLSTGDGALLTRLEGQRPVFVDGLAITPDDTTGALVATGAATGEAVWRRPVGGFTPIAIGHDLYLYRGDRVTALDAATGRSVWGAKLGEPKQGSLAVAPGLLLVAHGNRLSAWESVFKPRPRRIALGASAFDVLTGRRFVVAGVLGSRLRGNDARVRVQWAPWRGGRFRSFRPFKPSRDGYFGWRTSIRRNTRFRAASGRARSRPVTVYAYPRVKLGRARWTSGNRLLRLRPRVRAPGVRLSGRTFVLYLHRRGTRRAKRIDAGPIRGKRATLIYRPLRNVSRRDRVYHCVRGGPKLGLGRPTKFARRCGARTVPPPTR